MGRVSKKEDGGESLSFMQCDIIIVGEQVSHYSLLKEQPLVCLYLCLLKTMYCDRDL